MEVWDGPNGKNKFFLRERAHQSSEIFDILMILFILLTFLIGLHCNLPPIQMGFKQNHQNIKNSEL